jgi:hypothetical protein
MSAAQNRTTPYLIITSNPEDGMSVSNSSDEEDDEEEEEEAEESR